MSMTDKKTYKSEFEAWKWVHEMFPGKQWYLDHESSERAGIRLIEIQKNFIIMYVNSAIDLKLILKRVI